MDLNITKARNFPMNRDGETIPVRAEEGDFVGLTENTDGEAEIVVADADSAVAEPAMGVLMETVNDPADLNVTGYEDSYIEQRQLRREMREQEYTLVGDEATYITHGIHVTDVDDELNMTPGEPVYLDVGGGVTQTKPTGTGEVQQKVGVAVDAYTFLLDVDFEYQTA